MSRYIDGESTKGFIIYLTIYAAISICVLFTVSYYVNLSLGAG